MLGAFQLLRDNVEVMVCHTVGCVSKLVVRGQHDHDIITELINGFDIFHAQVRLSLVFSNDANRLTPCKLCVEIEELVKQTAWLQSLKVLADFGDHNGERDSTEVSEISRVEASAHGPEADGFQH